MKKQAQKAARKSAELMKEIKLEKMEAAGGGFTIHPCRTCGIFQTGDFT